MNNLESLIPFSEIILMIFVTILVVFMAYYIFRRNGKIGFRILALVSLLLMYFLYCDKLDKVYLAPSYVSFFTQLTAETSWPLRITTMQAEDKQYIEAVIFPGKLPSLIRLTSFRSGMPAYVFDSKGRLVDSTIDHHDDDRYQTNWEVFKQRKEITETEFIEMINDRR